MEIHYRELRQLTSSERKQKYREMERAVASRRPFGRIRTRLLALFGVRVGAPPR